MPANEVNRDGDLHRKDPQVVVRKIPKADVDTVLDRAIRRERQFFRLTQGQRRSLRVKRAD